MPVVIDVLSEIAKNVAMSLPPVRAWRLRRPRAGVSFTGSLDELDRYAFLGLDLLTEHVGRLAGRSIVEFGPGDLLTSGLAMLAAGAARYAAVDRFAGDYGGLEGRRWYAAIQARWPEKYPGIPWPAWLAADEFPHGYPDRVASLELGVERVPDIGRFDVVCSFQVGEHVSDIAAFANATRAMLAPGGVAVHRVDFGPHGVWEKYSDPLTFLRLPDLAWRWMGSARGTPNRRRVHEFVEAFQAAGLTVELHTLEVFESARIDCSKLNRRFRAMPLESVRTRTALFVCRADRP
jgi:hypothetical protein